MLSRPELTHITSSLGLAVRGLFAALRARRRGAQLLKQFLVRKVVGIQIEVFAPNLLRTRPTTLHDQLATVEEPWRLW